MGLYLLNDCSCYSQIKVWLGKAWLWNQLCRFYQTILEYSAAIWDNCVQYEKNRKYKTAKFVQREPTSWYLLTLLTKKLGAGPRSAVGNVSGYRCVSDCRSRGRKFDPGPVPYFRGDWSWNDFYGHSPPFRWFVQEGLLSVTSESMCTYYWLSACSSLPRKKCG